MIENMDMASTHGRTEDNMQANGLMESNMVKAPTDKRILKKEEEFGKRVKGLVGQMKKIECFSKQIYNDYNYNQFNLLN